MTEVPTGWRAKWNGCRVARPRWSTCRHAANRGKGAACVPRNARREGIALGCFADADGATPIDEEHRLAAAIDAGGACGDRIASWSAARHRPPSDMGSLGHRRRVFAASAASPSAFLCTIPSAGSRCFAASRQEALSAWSRGTLPLDLEAADPCQRLGYRVAEVPISWSDVPGSRL